MDPAIGRNALGFDVQIVTAKERCAICARRSTDRTYALHERIELAVPAQAWLLCAKCAAAVAAEVERAALRTPLRVRVALGIVATERRPPRCPKMWNEDYWELMPEEQFNKLLIRVVLALFTMPALVFLLVTAFTAARQ